jgi:DNA-binding transcriptional LysR family regulator
MAIDLAHWRVFLTVAERGSLMKAAEALHGDQPGLSRSLRRLERLIGAPLFVRSSRGLTPTELGRRLHGPVRDLVAQADAIEARARAEARRGSGVLKVGAIDVYPVTAAIAAACQDLVVADRAVATEVITLPWLAHSRALLERTIDIGFTLTVDGRLPDPAAVRSLPLWDESGPFALLSDRHPLARADLIDPRDLAELPLHLPDKAEHPDVYDLTLELLADAGVPAPRRAPRLGTFATVIAHVAAGDGWLLSASTLARHPLPGLVAKPLATTSRRAVRFELIWHATTDPAVVEAFSQRIRRALAQESAEAT